MNRRFLLCCFIVTSVVGLTVLSQLAAAAPQKSSSSVDARVQSLIEKAGNAEHDEQRLGYLEQLVKMPDVPSGLHKQILLMRDAVDEWVHTKHLPHSPNLFQKDSSGIDSDSPLYPMLQFYRANVVTWKTLESGSIWKHKDLRDRELSWARARFEAASRAFPKNRVIRMYLGEKIQTSAPPVQISGIPAWAIYQRAALGSLTDIIEWWIKHRMQPNGEYGGGWGDDCEMWRWWMPVLIGFDNPDIVAAQERFSRDLLSQPHMTRGYTTKMTDVEHNAEDSADAITPMMFLDPNNKEWRTRALRIADLARTRWFGRNERGFLQFKSTYFNVDGVSDDPRKACDTVYHPRVLESALLYWQRTGDPELGRMFTDWMDTWVEATARSERGKPAGIIPSAIHWPDGNIGGIIGPWWYPHNHNADPLYVWPSAMYMMTNTLLLTSHMTGDTKYEDPILSMARVRLDYVKHPPKKTPEPGSKMWCAANMKGIREVISKRKLLMGRTDLDELIRLDGSPYMQYRMGGDISTLSNALRDTAESLRVNFPGYTSEVRYTDRVLRFPQMFLRSGIYKKPLPDFHVPDTELLFSTLTGEPGSGLYFPINAVRWLTPSRDIAALVTESGQNRFESELVHFGKGTRRMGAELYLLEPGKYTITLINKSTGEHIKNSRITITGQHDRIEFQIPSLTPCVLRVEPDNG